MVRRSVPLPFHQQGVAFFCGSVPAAGLDQTGIVADQVGEMDQLVERVWAGISPAPRPDRFGCGSQSSMRIRRRRSPAGRSRR